MTADGALVAGGRQAVHRPFGPAAGTAALVRLYLRLERVRVAVWVLGLVLTIGVTVPALESTYPDTAARQSRAALVTTPAAVMMSGPAFGAADYTVGAMTANELSLTVLVAAAVMSILLVTRRTRAEEESGRLEVLRASFVGRDAAVAASLLTVAVADVAVGVGVAVTLVATGLEVAGSLAFGLSAALTGLAFGAVAAVTAQLTEHPRTASGTALAVLGVAFVTRGIGDVMEPTGSWLSWCSPVAWAQQTRMYVDLRWWPLLLSAGLTLALTVAAVALSGQRDIGAGLVPVRRGRSQADPALLSVPGLARRQLRGALTGWAVGLAAFATAFGALADSLRDAVDDIPALADWLAGGTGSVTGSFAATTLSFLSLGALVFAVSAVLRLGHEEQAGRTALVVVTGASRTRWLVGWLAVTGVQTLLLLVVAGAGAGLGVATVTGDGGWVADLAVAAMAYLPAVAVLAAAAAALVAAVPRMSGVAWVPVAHAVVVTWFGPVLDLPDWVVGLSPFDHIARVPVERLGAGPVVTLTAAATVLLVVAAAVWRRRDVTA